MDKLFNSLDCADSGVDCSNYERLLDTDESFESKQNRRGQMKENEEILVEILSTKASSNVLPFSVLLSLPIVKIMSKLSF
jgi:hypothetical protein